MGNGPGDASGAKRDGMWPSSRTALAAVFDTGEFCLPVGRLVAVLSNSVDLPGRWP